MGDNELWDWRGMFIGALTDDMLAVLVTGVRAGDARIYMAESFSSASRV